MSLSPTREALERAVREREFVLHYQPKVSLSRGEVVGAEALVRWDDGGTDGVVPPDVFLPLAEESGLLHEITLGLLDQVVEACTALRGIRPGLSLSMNVAPNDLAESVISTRIGELLGAGTIEASELQIEITESAVMGHVDAIRDDLGRLKELGIAVLMDDFGTGHSSIDRLSQLPFTALKLDQGVVRRMGTSRRNLDVVKASISMARELRMTSIAEGVESAGACDLLIANGCEEAQGYWIARPMSFADLAAFVARPHDFEGSELGRLHHAVVNLLHFRKCLVDAVFCGASGRGEALDSVMDPGTGGDFADSRVGAWYVASAERLHTFEVYRAMEAPLRRLHVEGNALLDALRGRAGGDVDGESAMAGIDPQVEHLVHQMHTLERRLLAVRRQRSPGGRSGDGPDDSRTYL